MITKDGISATAAGMEARLLQVKDLFSKRETMGENQTFVLLRLATATTQAFGRLCTHAIQNDLQYVCFEVRNLLELMVWSGYCAKSVDNAQRFNEDAFRDANGWGTAAADISQILNAFPVRAAFIVPRSTPIATIPEPAPFPELGNAFLKVVKAAETLGPVITLLYARANTFLSKFVHPTALSVLIDTPDDTMAQLCENAFHLGLALAYAVFSQMLALAMRQVGGSTGSKNLPD